MRPNPFGGFDPGGGRGVQSTPRGPRPSAPAPAQRTPAPGRRTAPRAAQPAHRIAAPRRTSARASAHRAASPPRRGETATAPLDEAATAPEAQPTAPAMRREPPRTTEPARHSTAAADAAQRDAADTPATAAASTSPGTSPAPLASRSPRPSIPGAAMRAPLQRRASDAAREATHEASAAAGSADAPPGIDAPRSLSTTERPTSSAVDTPASNAARAGIARPRSMPRAGMRLPGDAGAQPADTIAVGVHRLVPGALGRAVRSGVAVQRLAVRPAFAARPSEVAPSHGDARSPVAATEAAADEAAANAIAAPGREASSHGAADAATVRSTEAARPLIGLGTRALRGALPVAGALGARARLPMVSTVEGMQVAGSVLGAVRASWAAAPHSGAHAATAAPAAQEPRRERASSPAQRSAAATAPRAASSPTTSAVRGAVAQRIATGTSEASAGTTRGEAAVARPRRSVGPREAAVQRRRGAASVRGAADAAPLLRAVRTMHTRDVGGAGGHARDAARGTRSAVRAMSTSPGVASRTSSPATAPRIERVARAMETLRADARPGAAALGVRAFASRAALHASAATPPAQTARRTASADGAPVQRIERSARPASLTTGSHAGIDAAPAAHPFALPRAASAVPLATSTVSAARLIGRVVVGAPRAGGARVSRAADGGEALDGRVANDAARPSAAATAPDAPSPVQRAAEVTRSISTPAHAMPPAASIGRIAALRLPVTPLQRIAVEGHLAMPLRASSAGASQAQPASADASPPAREANESRPRRAVDAPTTTRRATAEVGDAPRVLAAAPTRARDDAGPLQRLVRATAPAHARRSATSSISSRIAALASSVSPSTAAASRPGALAPLPRAVEASPLRSSATVSVGAVQRLAVGGRMLRPSTTDDTTEAVRRTSAPASRAARPRPSSRVSSVPIDADAPYVRAHGGDAADPRATRASVIAAPGSMHATATSPAPRPAVQRRAVGEVPRGIASHASDDSAIGARARRLVAAHAEAASTTLPRAAEDRGIAAATSAAVERVRDTVRPTRIGAASMPLARAARALPSLMAGAASTQYEGPGLPAVRAIEARATGSDLRSSAPRPLGLTSAAVARADRASTSTVQRQATQPVPHVARRTRSMPSTLDAPAIGLTGGAASGTAPAQRGAMRRAATSERGALTSGRVAPVPASVAGSRGVTAARASVGGLPVRPSVLRAESVAAHATGTSSTTRTREGMVRAQRALTPGTISGAAHASGVAQRLAAPGARTSTRETAPTSAARALMPARTAIGVIGRRALPRMNAAAANADIEVLHAAAVRPVAAGSGSDARTPPAAALGSQPRTAAASALGGASAGRAAAQRLAVPAATSTPPSEGDSTTRPARPRPGAGALRALPRSQAPETADLDVLHRAAVRPVAVAPTTSAGASEPAGTVGGGLGRADLAALLDQAMGVSGAGRAPVQRRGESVTSLPIGGMAGSVAAARAAASDAARRAVEESSAASGSVVSSGNSGGGTGGFGGGTGGSGGGHGGPHLRRSSVELPSRAITARAGGRSSGFGGAEPIQRLVDDEAEPELGVAAEASGDSDGRRSPAKQEQQLAELLDVLQERILAELERRGGRYRGVF